MLLYDPFLPENQIPDHSHVLATCTKGFLYRAQRFQFNVEAPSVPRYNILDVLDMLLKGARQVDVWRQMNLEKHIVWRAVKIWREMGAIAHNGEQYYLTGEVPDVTDLAIAWERRNKR